MTSLALSARNAGVERLESRFLARINSRGRGDEASTSQLYAANRRSQEVFSQRNSTTQVCNGLAENRRHHQQSREPIASGGPSGENRGWKRKRGSRMLRRTLAVTVALMIGATPAAGA